MGKETLSHRELIIDSAQGRNLENLLIVAKRQVAAARSAIKQQDSALAFDAVQRDAYLDNLKNRVLRQTAQALQRTASAEVEIREAAMAVDTIARNLEKIADFALAIINHCESIEKRPLLSQVKTARYFTAFSNSFDLLVAALESPEMEGALAICEHDRKVDQWYRVDFKKYRTALLSSPSEKKFTELLILREFEKIGDSLKNIGEALISFTVGSKLKLDHFNDLRAGLGEAEMRLQSLGDDAKSGCKIELVSHFGPEGESQSVYKVGAVHKIKAERDGIQRWHAVARGLAPELSHYRESDDQASMMLEFLPGATYQEILLSTDRSAMSEALACIWQTFGSAWQASRVAAIPKQQFMRQLADRMPVITDVNPDLIGGAVKLGKQRFASFNDLIASLSDREEELRAPYSVLLHGDLNIDNIVYDPIAQKCRLLDLHRSKIGDYVQDISVFLVSNFRLPISQKRIRKRITQSIMLSHEALRDYAFKYGDDHYLARLAFGLVRSLSTSTRFEMDVRFAAAMQKRSQYLAEKLVEFHGDWSDFDFDISILDL